MGKRRRRNDTEGLEAAEGFIDTLFLLLTFFIVQNVWQSELASTYDRFVNARKLNFVKAVEEMKGASPKGDKFIKIIIGKEFVQFDKGGLVTEQRFAFKSSAGIDQPNVEHLVFESTRDALGNILAQWGYGAEDILVRLYFERDATVLYTMGVYDALNHIGFKTVQWGLESQQQRL